MAGGVSTMQASVSAHIYKRTPDEDQSQFSDQGCFVPRENKTKDKSTLLIPIAGLAHVSLYCCLPCIMRWVNSQDI